MSNHKLVYETDKAVVSVLRRAKKWLKVSEIFSRINSNHYEISGIRLSVIRLFKANVLYERRDGPKTFKYWLKDRSTGLLEKSQMIGWIMVLQRNYLTEDIHTRKELDKCDVLLVGEIFDDMRKVRKESDGILIRYPKVDEDGRKCQ